MQILDFAIAILIVTNFLRDEGYKKSSIDITLTALRDFNNNYLMLNKIVDYREITRKNILNYFEELKNRQTKLTYDRR